MPGEVAGSVGVLSIEITSVPDTFGVLANQITSSISGGVIMGDTTSKSSGGFETGIPLLKSAVITCEYKPDPTDQAHIDLMAHWDAVPMTTFKIEHTREDGSGKVAGTYGISSFAPTFANGEVISYSLELTPSEAPTLT